MMDNHTSKPFTTKPIKDALSFSMSEIGWIKPDQILPEFNKPLPAILLDESRPASNGDMVIAYLNKHHEWINTANQDKVQVRYWYRLYWRDVGE